MYTYDKDKKIKREVAVKCIEKNKIAEFGVDFERYLQNEFEVINKLKHRNIVEYIDFFSSKACYYFVFEKCQQDLKSLLLEKGRLTEFEAQKLFKQLADALLYVNLVNVVHRDLKPANILIGMHGEIKLADFGLARTLNGANELMKTNVGTPYYQAPEIWEGKEYDEKADLWSVGIILF